ncbi:46 kDa FK506-binding nuclear protein [Mycetomoellerius zeteki]|uniref:46 kDa FK506-binding nuclear protein n=1 Tax=Mycetomoellerius zeteki TaxID=64791 RepID=UPI00084E7938|nr:PREDICTED: 46 kDa FK506-binding nuclear protein-like [Trachymyrmex zeteki]
MALFWAMILQPGNKYSQYVNESFRITMASLDITCASDKPIQVMMAYEQARFLLCTLHKDKPWQVQLNVLVQKETVVTLSCNGGSYVHLTGHYRINSRVPPFNPNWITTLSWHILNEKVNELKNKGTCLEELIEYLNKYTTVKVEKKWIVTPHIIKKKQIQEDRIPLQVLNLKRKSFMENNNRTEETVKRIRPLLYCNENINFNNDSSENSSRISSKESSENSSENFSEGSFGSSSDDSSMESNDDDDYKENKPPIYHLRPRNRQKQKRRKKESEKREIKEKQQKAKVIEKKLKEDLDKTKKNSKQQGVRIIKGGVKVQELKPGTGKIAEVGNYVTIYYVAHVKIRCQMLEEFDRLEGLGLRFKLGTGFVIDGLDVGVVGMKIDEKRRLIIPPNMAYGEEGYRFKVPPNSTVIYDVELKKVE